MNRFGVLNLLIAITLAAGDTEIDCNKRPEKIDRKVCCQHDPYVTKELMEKCKTHLPGGVVPPTDGGLGGPGGPGGPKGPRGQGGPGGPGGPKGHGPPTCFFECVMNETGIIKGSDIDDAKLSSYLSETLSGSADFIPVAKNAFKTCAEKAKQKPSDIPPSDCDPSSAMILHCAEMETMMNCPTSAWKNDAGCNDFREFVKKCPHPHGKPQM